MLHDNRKARLAVALSMAPCDLLRFEGFLHRFRVCGCRRVVGTTLGMQTLCVHGGEPSPRTEGCAVVPIYQTATFLWEGEEGYDSGDISASRAWSSGLLGRGDDVRMEVS